MYEDINSFYRYLEYEDFYSSLIDVFCGGYTLPIPDVLEAFRQMRAGLLYIHEQGLVHGSISPGTILIFPNSLKLSECGYGYTRCVLVYDCQCHDMYDVCYNRAPETQRNIEDIDMCSDIFSMGCVFYMYSTGGKHPFHNKKEPRGRFLIRGHIENGEQFIDGTFFFCKRLVLIINSFL